jgi:cell division protein FtsW
MAEKSPETRKEKIDFDYSLYLMLSCVSFLTIAGLLMSFSASFPFAAQHYSSGVKLFLKQLGSLMAALFASFIAYQIAKKYSLRKVWFIFWLLSVVFVLMTFFSGFAEEANGAVRWLDFGFIRFQPSEILKLAVIIASAHLGLAYVRTKEKYYLAGAFFIIIFSSLLVLLQKDMTTSIIVFLAGSTVLLVLPIKLRDLTFLAFVAIVGGIGGILLQDYRLKRLLVFLDPWKAGDAGRQVVVSLLALASGGIKGEGLGKSIFKYNVLPEAHTDFIFAIIGSELGLFGSLVVIGALMAMFFFGFVLANKMKDEFARSVTLAIVTMLAFQAIINIGGTLQVLPPTGVPLPFISFGGTSLVVSYLSLGLIVGLWVWSGNNAQNSRRRRGY